MSDLGWKNAKVNLDLWNLFIAIVSLVLTSSKNNDSGFNSIQKLTLSKKTI